MIAIIMVDYAECSRKMVEILGLKHEPVAITLIKKGQPIPEGYPQPEKPIRHCQSVMRARKGECLLLPASKHACPVGASALGLLPIPEKVESGKFHYGLGMYQSEEAAKHTMDVRPHLEPESLAATLVCPLSKAKVAPDVIVVTGTPEQIYWLLPAAATYEKGGRITIETASFQASCVDSTIMPYLTGLPNVSFGCYGCRKTTDIAPEEMLVGFPAGNLGRLVEILEKLKERPIPACREKTLAT
ncbi:MAG: DUF169 domain-containing protein [Methanomassiliicoccales archaeon]|nr:DUF169 domain-containing protein [Methanomassiliicoccales archaeon]